MSATTSTRLAATEKGLSRLGASLHSNSRSGAVPGGILWLGIGLLILAGFWGVSAQFEKLWEIWTTDPLRSIGMWLLPASIFLILIAWRRCGWELDGSWWGIVPVAVAFAPKIFHERLVFFWTGNGEGVNLLPSVLPIFLYVFGALLLFAGTRVCRAAWFPLALLLCLQPVPEFVVRHLDLPLQGFSAGVARWFASLLGLAPTNAELLRLMFSPHFGMFIAPGCDGMRGAITLGYLALLVGYWKRVTFSRWAAYAAGGFLLGHVFNLIRLCALVLYYKIALGHVQLERAAANADYAIGGLLFLLGTYLFVWMAFRKDARKSLAVDPMLTPKSESRTIGAYVGWKAAPLALLVVAAFVADAGAMTKPHTALAVAIRSGAIIAEQLNARVPTQVGPYTLTRVWQEQVSGVPVLEAATFDNAQNDEIEIGIWLPPSGHSIQQSLLTHGEIPKFTAIRGFRSAPEQTVRFSTALYDDGVTETLVGDTSCTPSNCQPALEDQKGLHLAFTETVDRTTQGRRSVPIFFKIQKPHSNETSAVAYEELLRESQEFLSSLDLNDLSRRFQ